MHAAELIPRGDVRKCVGGRRARSRPRSPAWFTGASRGAELTISITHVFAGIPTRDFPAALAWYERFLGRAPDRLPHSAEAVWQLADRALIYVVSDAERAGNTLVTLIVDDLDAWASRLTDLGIPVEAEEGLPGGARKLALIDLDRNSISLGQVSS